MANRRCQKSEGKNVDAGISNVKKCSFVVLAHYGAFAARLGQQVRIRSNHYHGSKTSVTVFLQEVRRLGVELPRWFRQYSEDILGSARLLWLGFAEDIQTFILTSLQEAPGVGAFCRPEHLVDIGMPPKAHGEFGGDIWPPRWLFGLSSDKRFGLFSGT
jgi:hypothetical protein